MVSLTETNKKRGRPKKKDGEIMVKVLSVRMNTSLYNWCKSLPFGTVRDILNHYHKKSKN